MTRPLRLIQVGAGLMGRTWLHTIRENPDCELIGVVDLDMDVARRAAADAGIEGVLVSDSLASMLEQVEADAVVNVTVPAVHTQVSMTALFAGVPVLCEKPLAHTVADALAAVAASEATGVMLMVSQSRRYFSSLATLREQLARLGEVRIAECSFFKGPHFGGFREQMPYPLLVDMAIHQFDLSRDLLKAEPVRIHCSSFNPSWSWFDGDAAARVSVEFDNGAMFGYSGSWVSQGLETSWNGAWRFGAEAGTALWDGDNAPLLQMGDGEIEKGMVLDSPEETAGALAEFVGVIRNGDVPDSRARRNVMSLAMVESAITSAETSRTIEITETLEAGYSVALSGDYRPEVREVLRGWGSASVLLG